jgi:hypothetical protein
MGLEDVRRGVTQAKQNEGSASFAMLIILGSSIYIGCYYQSWIAFGVALATAVMLLSIPQVRFIFVAMMAVICGHFGHWAGGLFSENAATVLMILGGLIGGGAGTEAGTHFDDLNHSDAKTTVHRPVEGEDFTTSVRSFWDSMSVKDPEK